MRFRVEVPYGDIDAMGHLNNVAYLRYLEWARQKYWLSMLGSSDFWDIDFVVARCEIDYRSSVEMGEVLEIEIHVSRMGASSFDFSYTLRATPQTAGGNASATNGAPGTEVARVVAQAKTTQVSYDWETRTKKPLSEERRRQIESFEAAGQ